MRLATTLSLALMLFARPAAAKDPALGATTFTVYEGYMSPAQQPGEETDAPKVLATPPLAMVGMLRLPPPMMVAPS